MKLKTDDVKTFLSNAAFINPNVLYPLLNDMVRIESNGSNIVFVKTNMNVFCVTTVEDANFNDNEVFLITDKSLAALCHTTKSDVINIEQHNNCVVMTGMHGEVVQSPFIDPHEFANIPVAGNAPIPINSESLFCIKVAGNYISQEQRITAASFVQIGADGIFSTNNNNILYHQAFTDLPSAFIDADALSVIKPVNGATFSESENYAFINYANVSYSFIKSVVENPLNYKPMLSTPSTQNFTITKDELLGFCILVKSSAASKAPIIELDYDGSSLSMLHNDDGFNIKVKRTYDITGTACDKFKLDVIDFEKFIRPLPYEKFTFARMGKHFKITSPDDELFTGVIVGIS